MKPRIDQLIEKNPKEMKYLEETKVIEICQICNISTSVSDAGKYFNPKIEAAQLNTKLQELVGQTVSNPWNCLSNIYDAHKESDLFGNATYEEYISSNKANKISRGSLFTLTQYRSNFTIGDASDLHVKSSINDGSFHGENERELKRKRPNLSVVQNLYYNSLTKFENCLKRAEISPDQYRICHDFLVFLGYNTSEVKNSFIINTGDDLFKKKCNSILSLTQFITKEDLTTIKSTKNGIDKLVFLFTHCERLIKCKFSANLILQIMMPDDGLDTITRYLKLLNNPGVNESHIAVINNRTNSLEHLAAFEKYFLALSNHGFSVLDIVEMAIHPDGPSSLFTIQDEFPRIKFQFSIKEIVDILTLSPETLMSRIKLREELHHSYAEVLFNQFSNSILSEHYIFELNYDLASKLKSEFNSFELEKLGIIQLELIKNGEESKYYVTINTLTALEWLQNSISSTNSQLLLDTQDPEIRDDSTKERDTTTPDNSNKDTIVDALPEKPVYRFK